MEMKRWGRDRKGETGIKAVFYKNFKGSELQGLRNQRSEMGILVRRYADRFQHRYVYSGADHSGGRWADRVYSEYDFVIQAHLWIRDRKQSPQEGVLPDGEVWRNEEVFLYAVTAYFDSADFVFAIDGRIADGVFVSEFRWKRNTALFLRDRAVQYGHQFVR